MDCPVHGTLIATAREAEIIAEGNRSRQTDAHCMFDEFVDTLILCRTYWHDRNPESLFKGIDADGSSVFPDLIHHVQCDYHRQAKLHELSCQVEVTLDVRGINDVNDAVGMVFDEEITGNDLLSGVRGERVNARQIGDGHVGMLPYDAVLSVHGDSREITHMLV